jgi:hypothetical protein
MPVLDRALDRDPVPGQVLVLEQAPVLDQVLVMEQGLRALGQAAQAWVLGQGLVLVREALDPVARKDRTAMDLVMETAMTATARQMEVDTAPVLAGTGPAPPAINTIPSSLL